MRKEDNKYVAILEWEHSVMLLLGIMVWLKVPTIMGHTANDRLPLWALCGQAGENIGQQLITLVARK